MYINHILNRRSPVPPANVYNGQFLPRLLDFDNSHGDAWAYSAFSGETFDHLLILGGFESLIN